MKMEREIHHIDEYFNEGLENIEVNPPEEVWNNITKELDRKRRVRLFTIWTGMAAGLALFASLGIYFANNTNVKPQLVTSSKAILNIHQNLNTNKVQTLKSEQSYQTTGRLKSPVSEQPVNHALKKPRNVETIKPVEIKSDNLAPDETINNLVILTDIYNFEDQSQQAKKEKSLEPLNFNSSNATKQENKISSATKPIESNKIADIDAAAEPFLIEKPKPKHWSLEGQFAPQYSYRNVVKEDSKSVYDENENGLVAYAGGVKVNYKAGKRLTFQTGVFYSVLGQTGKAYEIKQASGISTYAGRQRSIYWLNNSWGPVILHDGQQSQTQNQSISSTDAAYGSVYVNKASASVLNALSTRGDEIKNAKMIQQVKFIEIPVLARYLLIDKKIGCNLVGGVSTNVMVKNNIYIKQDGSKQDIAENGDLQKINYSSTIGIGINYHWFKNINLTLEPTYKYYLNALSLDENRKVHLYAFGIYTGLTYKF